MCTVTYLPYRDGFVLTHNRDEAPSRSPQGISRVVIGRQNLIFPRDTKAGGGWIAATRQGHTACLLNGAFLKHRHLPPYRRSRGLVLLDFFEWADPDDFFERYDLEDIEPFTFLYFTPHRVTEFRWDGQLRHRTELDPKAPHFWCSATLYPPEMQIKREQVFQQWLQKHFPSTVSRPPSTVYRPPSTVHRLPSAVSRLHRTGSVNDPENDYVMNRNGRVCTVSITQVVVGNAQVRMRYSDLLEGHQDAKQMVLPIPDRHVSG